MIKIEKTNDLRILIDGNRSETLQQKEVHTNLDTGETTIKWFGVPIYESEVYIKEE